MTDTSNYTITFTPEYCEEVFYNALCNGLGYFQEYGVALEYDQNEYKATKEESMMINPCYEEVLMQMLRTGKKLWITDYENGDDDLNVNITLETVRERVNKIPDWVKIAFIEEQDDATSADIVLQTVAFGEVIFA